MQTGLAIQKFINTKTACVQFGAGCPRSMLDACRLVKYLKINGWEIGGSVNKAKLILLGLCAFDHQSERTSQAILRTFKRIKDANAQIVIFGCFGEILNLNEDYKNQVFTLKYHGIDKIDDLIMPEIKFKEIQEINVINEYRQLLHNNIKEIDRLRYKVGLLLRSHVKVITRFACGLGPQALSNPKIGNDFFIKISKGCTGNCSYCAIKKAAGDLVSYPIESILAQIENGLERGYRVFRLLGEDVGGYGKDCGKNFIELIEIIFRNEVPFRLVIEDFNPKWIVRFSPEIIRLFTKNQARFSHIVIPIQSGSEKIIKSMGRKYTVEAAVESLLRLRKEAPKLKISTHVIVGFPGERNDDFQKTITMLKRIKFEHVEAHRYTDRPKTVASNFAEKIPESRKIMRLWRLRLLFPDTCRIRI